MRTINVSLPHTKVAGMSDPEIPGSGCFIERPHLKSVRGARGHELQSSLARYPFEDPDASCPIYETHRAREMAEPARGLEGNS